MQQRLQQFAALVVMTVFVAAMGWFLAKQLVGDPGGPVAYFWTWDMYPNYETESARRVVLGATADGRYVQLVPGERDHFRWGNHGDASRLDLDRRDPNLQRIVSAALARVSSAGGLNGTPVARVVVAENYWPARRNAEPAGAEASFPNSGQTYWRIAAEGSVATDGSVSWKPAQ